MLQLQILGMIDCSLGLLPWNSKSVIEDLESAGYIDPLSPTKVSQTYEDLEYGYSKNQDRKFDPITPGVFM